MVLSGKGLKLYPSVPAIIALVSEKYYGCKTGLILLWVLLEDWLSHDDFMH